MYPKSFKYWDEQDLVYTFKLKRNDTSKLLADWLNSDEPISENEKIEIEKLRIENQKNADYWNEEELKIKFIGLFLNLVNFDNNQFKVFYERNLSAMINNIELKGVVDMLIATGFQKPIKPFFFFQEYKPIKAKDSDPLGQLLAELLVAQEINKSDNLPIYGCYIISKSWYFVTLKDKEYAVSDVFISSQDDLFQVFKILRKMRTYIEEFIKLNP